MSEDVLSDMTKYFIKLNNYCFFAGLPNIWKKELPQSQLLYHSYFRKASNLIIIIMIFAECMTFYTQPTLTERQRTNLTMFSFSHPILFIYIVLVELYAEDIKHFLFELTVTLKVVYNDREVERQMIKKSKIYSFSFISIFGTAVILYGLEAITDVIKWEGNFVTLITCWPDVNSNSWSANLVRVFIYIAWWLFTFRLTGIYALVLSTIVGFSHQFKNIQSYYYSLNDIFDEDLSDSDIQCKYEEAFKIGIEMHSHTLRILNEFQMTIGKMFNGQIILNVTVIVMLMVQMMNVERSMVNVIPIVSTGICMLTGTAMIMCNAGDITVESSTLTTAVYCSGWHHCRPLSRRLGILLAFTMTQGQKPVAIYAMKILALSYQTYVSIVKSSYSVFSVIY